MINQYRLFIKKMSEQKELKTKIEGFNLIIYLEDNITKENSSSLGKLILDTATKTPQLLLKFDLSNLNGISSAGIHMLINIKNSLKNQPNIKLENVTEDIYNIFNTTGLTELFDIEQEYKKFKMDNLEQVGKGANSKVLKLDEDKVIKVFSKNSNLDIVIRNEKKMTKKAFLCGIPTPLTYDIVHVGDCYGLIYEYLDAKDLIKIMEEDKAHLVDYIKQFTQLMKHMHSIEIDSSKLNDLRSLALRLFPSLKGKVLNDEDYEKVKKIYENIPDKKTFVHGDCHPGNVMVKNGKMYFIDLAAAGVGHHINDLMGMYNIYRINIHNPDKMKNSPLLKNFTMDELNLIWDTFLKEYIGTNDENILKKAEEQIAGFAFTRILFAEIALPGYLPKPVLEMYTKKAVSFYDKGLEPLVF